MREILFRGKAINRDKGYHRTKYKNGDWVYGLVTRLYDDRFENLPAEMADINGVSGIEVDHKTFGQYTGLTDKNGVKIFEGDILRDDDNEENGVVEFVDGEFYVVFGNVETHGIADIACCCYVIGNIHDNPELLKGGADND
ncbi:MAG: YopX family protein [Oscillospiraceae bacterium]